MSRSASRTTRRLGSAVAAVLLAASAGACAGEQPQSMGTSVHSSDRASACHTITRDQIEEVTGWRLDAPVVHGDVCDYSDRHAETMVQVQLHDGGEDAFARLRSSTEADGLGPVQELSLEAANEAYELPEHGIVAVRVGDRFAQLSAIGQLDDWQRHDLASLLAESLR